MISRVHIVAQPANRYIVAFHIAISRYGMIFYSHTRWRQSRDTDVGALVYTEVTAMMYGHLQSTDSNPQTF